MTKENKEEKGLVVIGGAEAGAMQLFKSNLSVILSGGKRQEIRSFVGELENLPRNELREVICAACPDSVSMCSLVESAFDFDGGKELTPLIAALTPEEIGAIIDVSPNIFRGEHFFLVHPNDFIDPSKWEPITVEQKKIIEESGDQNLISRISKLGGNDDPRGNKAVFQTAYVMHSDVIDVSIESISSYILAICHAEQDDDWKEESLEAMGLEMLRYVFDRDSEIREMCYRISPVLHDRVMATRNDLRQEAIAERHLDILEKVAGRVDDAVGERQSSEDIMDDLKSLLDEKELDAIDAVFKTL